MRLRSALAGLPGPPPDAPTGRASAAPGVGDVADGRLPAARSGSVADPRRGVPSQHGPALVSAHLPQRPPWTCEACKRPWPCAEAKETLLGEYKGFRTALILYLAGQMAEAREDLAELDSGTCPDDLMERFVSWARAAAE